MKALRLIGNILIWPLALSKPLDRLHHSLILRILRRREQNGWVSLAAKRA